MAVVEAAEHPSNGIAAPSGIAGLHANPKASLNPQRAFPLYVHDFLTLRLALASPTLPLRRSCGM